MSALRSIAERVERLTEEVDTINRDKADIFKEAKSNGYDVRVLKAVIAHIRKSKKDPEAAAEHDELFAVYLHEIQNGTTPANIERAHVQVREGAVQ